MGVREIYDRIGSNYDEVVRRMGSEALIERFAFKFLNETSYQELKECIELGDIEGSFRMAHTLKGVALNLGFSNLAKAATALTEQLRPKDTPADPELVKEVDMTYQAVIDALNAYKK